MGMTRVESSKVIDLPLEEVFASVRDPVQHLQWESSTLQVEQTSESPIGMGARHRGAIRFLGRRIDWTSEVTSYEPNTRVVFRVDAGSMELDESWILEPVEGGTRVTFVFEGELRGFWRLVGPIAVRMWQRQAEKDLANMKVVLEAQA